MIKKELLVKFAKLTVRVGANVQKGQLVNIGAPLESKDLTREIVKQAYEAGAKRVLVNWTDAYVNRYNYDYQSTEDLINIPQWYIDKNKYIIDQGACMINITSPIPEINKGVDPKKMQALQMAAHKAMPFMMDYLIKSKGQWTIVAAPNKAWAKQVFPELSEEDALKSLWDAILKTSRVNEDTDPLDEWEKHNQAMKDRNKLLTDYAFDKLSFKNSLGTDIEIKLVDDHVWVGGGDTAANGTFFNPNIPTEENFTMPHRDGVNGIVFASMPLSYQGVLIEDFWLKFKDGKVIDYGAKTNKSALENILNIDEGAKHLGEIALISYDSPISKTGILFYNTLFDENASCHMALGRAIPGNIKGGNNMTAEELQEKGCNMSMTHVDFMFGSFDLSVVGTTKDGKEITVFKDGNFVI